MKPFKPAHVIAARSKIQIPILRKGGPVGVGDLAKQITTRVGITPCPACLQRAQYLNQWATLTPAKKMR